MKLLLGLWTHRDELGNCPLNKFKKKKKQPKGNCFIHCTFTSLSYCADEEKNEQEATPHHPQPLWLLSLWTPVITLPDPSPEAGAFPTCLGTVPSPD